MTRLGAYSLMVAAWLSNGLAPALAQQQPQRTYNFTMKLSADQTNAVLNKIGELPWVVVNPVLQDLLEQLKAQDAPTAPAPTVVPEPAPPAPKLAPLTGE